MKRKRVLIFAPYGAWAVHHQLDAVIGTALRLRGCDVVALLCDGIFDQCLIAGAPYSPKFCSECANAGMRLFGQFGLPTVQMRSLLMERDILLARKWAESLPADQLPKASFSGSLLGKWVAIQIYGYFKTSELDLESDHVVSTYRRVLYNVALVHLAYSKFLDDWCPDFVFCYSGEHAYYRTAFELSRRRNLPVLVHERGPIDDSFRIFVNSTNIMNENTFSLWDNHWKHVSLTSEQLQQVRALLLARETGGNSNFLPVYQYATDDTSIRRSLRIAPDARLIVLFTDGDWEYKIMEEGYGEEPMFSSQTDWILATARLTADRNEYVVIRHHPLGAGSGTFPPAKAFLSKMCKVNNELGPHVRVVMPGEKITSYSLLWNADAALITYCTLGAEAMARCIPTVSVANMMFLPMGISLVKHRSEYREIIDDAIQRSQSFTINDLSQAYRYLYYVFYRMSFTFRSFGIREIYGPDIRVRSVEDLSEGQDPSLDRICSHVLHNTPIYSIPEPGECPSGREEEEFLTREISEIKRRKTEIKSSLANGPAWPEPLVTVVRARQDGTYRNRKTRFSRSLERSRHKNIEYMEMPASMGEPQSLSAGLEDVAARAQGEIIYIGTDNLYLDESILSTSADLLSNPDSAPFDGVLWGAWIADPDESFKHEVFSSNRGVENLEQLTSDLGRANDPVQLQSFVVLRISSFRRLIEQIRGRADLAAAFYRLLFSADAPFNLHPTLQSLLVIYSPEDPDKLISQAQTLLNEGQAEKALDVVESARLLVGAHNNSALEGVRIMAKVHSGKVLEAYVAAEAAVMHSPDNPTFWHFHSKILLHLLQHGYVYDAVAQAIESVEGYLAPGQERFLFEKVMSLPEDAVILEIGGYLGRSTVAMAFACVGTRRHIYCIDTFFGNDGPMGRSESFLDVWRMHLRQFDLERYVTPVPGYSYDVISRWEERPAVDFAFLDGSHEYPDILRDFKMVYPLVKEGGWMALHDVEPAWPGPWRVWRQSAMPVLAGHEYCSTLACGQKMERETHIASDDTLYSFAVDWAHFIGERFQGAQPLRDAMLQTVNSKAIRNAALEKAHMIIALMPDELKTTLRHMLSKEAAPDPFLHYWNGILLMKEGLIEEAKEDFGTAIRLSEGMIEKRLKAFFEL